MIPLDYLPILTAFMMGEPSATPETPVLPPSEAPPANCEFGRANSYDPLTLGDVGGALAAGAEVFHNPTSLDAWAAFVDKLDDVGDAFDYLKLEAPSHVLIGGSHRYHANLFDMFANVRFYTSEDGYVGKDKSNIEANSYKNIVFDSTHGYGLVWAARSGLCSARGVWVQAAPQLDLVVYDDQTASISYELDRFSKASLAGEPVRVSVTQQDEELRSFTIPAGQLSGTYTLEDFTYLVGLPVVASLSDGTFVASDHHTRTWQEVALEGPECAAACPESLGIYQGECQAKDIACNP